MEEVGLLVLLTLQEPQEQVPAQELEQQEVQALEGKSRGQQRFGRRGMDDIC